MSTVKNNVISKKSLYLRRFSQLARLGVLLFHGQDLANLWRIKNSNTLHTTLKRYVKQGLLIRIYRGLYSLEPVDRLNPLLLGIKALHKYSYVSTETVLAEEGTIQQEVSYITLISSVSKRFFIGENNYRVRRLADKYLYNEIGIVSENGVKKATMERAVADTLYFNPQAYFDAEKEINWNKVKKIQKNLGYPLTLNRYK